MGFLDSGGPRIVKADIAGSRSVIEALRSTIAEAEDELIASVQKSRALSAVRNEGNASLKDKYGMKGNTNV